MKKTLITINGVTVDGPTAAKAGGVAWTTAYQRIRKGWTPWDAVTTPTGYGQRKRMTAHERIRKLQTEIAYRQAEIDRIKKAMEVGEIERC